MKQINKMTNQYYNKLEVNSMKRKMIGMLIMCLFTIMMTGCTEKGQIGKWKVIQGSGDIKSESYDLKDFSKLNIARDFRVNVKKGDNFEVKVETNSDILEYLDVAVISDTLYAKYKEDVVIDNTIIAMDIVMPSLNDIQVKNDGKVDLNDAFEWDGDFNIELSNDGKLKGHITTNNMNISLNNDAIITLEGSSSSIEASGKSDSRMDLKAFKVVEGTITVVSDASCDIFVTDRINVTAKSEASVNIYGGGIINKVSVEEDASVKNIGQ